MRTERVAGTVVVSRTNAIGVDAAGPVHQLREGGMPIVSVDGHLPGRDAPFVSDDDAEAVDLCAANLADLHIHSNGVLIGPPL